MNVFVAGGSGLLGRELITQLKNNNVPFVTSYNSRPCEHGTQLDFGSKAAIQEFVGKHRPSVCINCIVERQVDVCDKDWALTKRINIDYAANLAQVCASHNIYLIHVSTDYVFDGAQGKGPFTPHSPTNPLNNYGISKLISEQRVRAAGGPHAIVRVPVLYTDAVEHLEECAVTLIGKKVMDRVSVAAEDGTSIRRPVYIPDFANSLLELTTEPKYGTFHYYNPISKTTKYDMAVMIAATLGKPHDHIRPADPAVCVGANRPFDTQLYDPELSTARTHTPIEEGIVRAFRRFVHPPLRATDPTQVLHLFDLDGTLLDSDRIHYQAYADALMECGIELSWKTFEKAINTGKVEELLRILGITDYAAFKERKQRYFLQAIPHAQFMPGAEDYLRALLDTNQTVVIVTNTSQESVDRIKQCLPLFARVRNWIVREDYSAPKPDPECYRLARSRYFKDQTYVLGYENTVAGYQAVSKVSDITYIVTQRDALAYKELAHNDVYFISDFKDV